MRFLRFVPPLDIIHLLLFSFYAATRSTRHPTSQNQFVNCADFVEWIVHFFVCSLIFMGLLQDKSYHLIWFFFKIDENCQSITLWSLVNRSMLTKDLPAVSMNAYNCLGALRHFSQRDPGIQFYFRFRLQRFNWMPLWFPSLSSGHLTGNIYWNNTHHHPPLTFIYLSKSNNRWRNACIFALNCTQINKQTDEKQKHKMKKLAECKLVSFIK